jgi:hypothetical protein
MPDAGDRVTHLSASCQSNGGQCVSSSERILARNGMQMFVNEICVLIYWCCQ